MEAESTSETAEAEDTSIDEIDPIKPHSDIESDDAGEIFDSDLVITPDDGMVVSPANQEKTTNP
jgi:hypothetical protein